MPAGLTEVTKRWFQCGSRLVCAPPKCGGTALYCAALGLDPAFGPDVLTMARRVTEFYTPDEVAGSGCEAVQAVREPIARFMSLWRDKCRCGDDNLPALRGMTPRQLMTVIEKDPEGNAHWLPQACFYRPGFKLVPYRFMCVYLGVRRLAVNTTRAADTDLPAPIDRILDHYAADVALAGQVGL